MAHSNNINSKLATDTMQLPDGRVGGLVGVEAVGNGQSQKSRRLSLSTAYNSSTNTAEWFDNNRPSEVVLTFVPTVSAANDAECKVTFDAPTDSVEEGWLNQGASRTADYPNITLVAGERSEPIYFTGLLSRLGALPDVAGDLIIEAA